MGGVVRWRVRLVRLVRMRTRARVRNMGGKDKNEG